MQILFCAHAGRLKSIALGKELPNWHCMSGIWSAEFSKFLTALGLMQAHHLSHYIRRVFVTFRLL